MRETVGDRMSAEDRTSRRTDPTTAPFRWANGKPWGSSVVRLLDRLRGRAVPRHWSGLLGAISAACLVVLVVTGLLLTIWYTPSSAVVRYSGPYPLLRGVEMSAAYASTLQISFEVPGGLLIRQAHHWAALLLPAVLLLQLLVTFFTGAFRKPRQWQWVLLFGVFIAALTAGWSGYALPDDLLAGTGLRIFQGVVLGVPVIGTWVSSLIFGGEFPGNVLATLYPIHVLLAPGGLIVLALLRLRLVDRVGPAQFPGPGRNEDTVVGLPVWPTAAARWFGMFVITIGVILLNAGLVEIAPVWRQGPSSSGAAGAGSQPDWYTAFLDGALRLVPPSWEVILFDRTWTLAVIVPLAAIGVFFAVIATYPFLERWIVADDAEHQLLDRPRDAPARTSLGAAGVLFYGTLWGAGSADLVATQFHVSFNLVIHVLQVLVLVGPVAAFLVAYTACLALQQAERERLTHGAESGVIVRLPSGGYVEHHVEVPAGERFVGASLAPVVAPEPHLNHRGALTSVGRFRLRVAQLYLADVRSPQHDDRAAGREAVPARATQPEKVPS